MNAYRQKLSSDVWVEAPIYGWLLSTQQGLSAPMPFGKMLNFKLWWKLKILCLILAQFKNILLQIKRQNSVLKWSWFLQECDYLRAIARPRLQISTVVDTKTGKVCTMAILFLLINLLLFFKSSHTLISLSLSVAWLQCWTKRSDTKSDIWQKQRNFCLVCGEI